MKLGLTSMMAAAAVLAMTMTSVDAGSITDTVAIAAGTTLTLGAYLPWKVIGVWRRCRRERFQNYDACSAQPGCQWKRDPERTYGGKCTAKGFLGMPEYWKSLKAGCARIPEKKTCKHTKRCYWSNSSDQCKPRVLNAFRNAPVDVKEYNNVVKKYSSAPQSMERPEYQEMEDQEELQMTDMPISKQQQQRQQEEESPSIQAYPPIRGMNV